MSSLSALFMNLGPPGFRDFSPLSKISSVTLHSYLLNVYITEHFVCKSRFNHIFRRLNVQI